MKLFRPSSLIFSLLFAPQLLLPASALDTKKPIHFDTPAWKEAVVAQVILEDASMDKTVEFLQAEADKKQLGIKLAYDAGNNSSDSHLVANIRLSDITFTDLLEMICAQSGCQYILQGKTVTLFPAEDNQQTVFSARWQLPDGLREEEERFTRQLRSRLELDDAFEEGAPASSFRMDAQKGILQVNATLDKLQGINSIIAAYSLIDKLDSELNTADCSSASLQECLTSINQALGKRAGINFRITGAADATEAKLKASPVSLPAEKKASVRQILHTAAASIDCAVRVSTTTRTVTLYRINKGMPDKTWNLSADLRSHDSDNAFRSFVYDQDDCEALLKPAGILFPPGAGATFTPGQNILKVRNTAEELAKVEAFVEAFEQRAREESLFQLTWKLPKDFLREIFDGNSVSDLKKNPEDTLEELCGINFNDTEGAWARFSGGKLTVCHKKSKLESLDEYFAEAAEGTKFKIRKAAPMKPAKPAKGKKRKKARKAAIESDSFAD